jgi:hypothetical protein
LEPVIVCKACCCAASPACVCVFVAFLCSVYMAASLHIWQRMRRGPPPTCSRLGPSFAYEHLLPAGTNAGCAQRWGVRVARPCIAVFISLYARHDAMLCYGAIRLCRSSAIFFMRDGTLHHTQTPSQHALHICNVLAVDPISFAFVHAQVGGLVWWTSIFCSGYFYQHHRQQAKLFSYRVLGGGTMQHATFTKIYGQHDKHNANIENKAPNNTITNMLDFATLLNNFSPVQETARHPRRHGHREGLP